MKLHQYIVLIWAFVLASVAAQEPSGWNYTYPFPVKYFSLPTQQQTLTMAYMDLPPAENTSAGSIKTILLLHGKNFCAATWRATAQVLSNAGYRVIMPDQIGFGKSSKPASYQFSLHQLAMNTKSLLDDLDITSLVVMGHSMGGMLATRFALMYPQLTERLVMVAPLGLEDWQALGVPYQSIDVTLRSELATTFSSIKGYQQATYYAGTWDPIYDEWVHMLASLYDLPGDETARFAYDMALVTDAIFIQPTIYELGRLRMETLLIIGEQDNTAIGKAWAPQEIRASLGRYDVLGRQAAEQIPNSTLVTYPDLGHAPQIQDPDRFHADLTGWLNSQ